MVGDNNVDPLGIISRIQEPEEVSILKTLELYVGNTSSAQADGTSQLELIVIAKDQRGQRLSQVPVSLVVPVNGGSVVAQDLMTDSGGEASWMVTTSTRKGQYQFKVTGGPAQAVLSNNVTLEFISGPLHLISLTANKMTLQTGGADFVELKAVAEDQFGNKMNNLSLSLTIPLNGGIPDNNPVTTDANGEALWTLSSSAVANYYEYNITKGAVSSNTVGLLFKSTTTPFISYWKTDIAGLSGNNQVKLPLISSANYKAIVDWGDGTQSILRGHDDPNHLHTYETPGTYEIKIEGVFERLYGHNGIETSGDIKKIIDVSQWGDIKWTSMKEMFFGATNLRVTATDAPDLSGVVDIDDMFRAVRELTTENFSHWDTGTIRFMSRVFMGSSFVGNISNWNTSSVENMSAMFRQATHFNNDISGWDVSNVKNMSQMFRTMRFNQNINEWDVSNVLDFSIMFDGNQFFNQPLNEWETDTATNVRNMFSGASAYNQDLSGWALPNVTQSDSFDTGANAWECSKRPASVKTCAD